MLLFWHYELTSCHKQGNYLTESLMCHLIIQYIGKNIPVLGVCLGHQAIGEVFGGKIIQAKNIVHGKVSKVTHYKDHLFKNIEDNFSATRYHSLVIDEATLPNELTKIAQLKDGTIMGVRHKTYPIVCLLYTSDAADE